MEPRYQWIRRVRIFVYESHEAPTWRDGRALVDLMLSANADAVRFPTTAWALTYFDSNHLPQHPAAGGRDYLRDMCDAARPRGLKVIPYNHVGGVLHTRAYELHPEWMATTYDGLPLRWEKWHYQVCVGNPEYQRAYIANCVEVVSKYDVAAMYFDGPSWYGWCQCRHCRDAFRRAYGFDLPRLEALSWEYGTWQMWDALRPAIIEDFVKRLAGAIKEVRDIPVILNARIRHEGDRGSGRAAERWLKHVEGSLTTEVSRPYYGAPTESVVQDALGILEQTKLGAAMGKACWCYTPPGPYESMVTDDALDTVLFGHLYLAHGGTPILEGMGAYLQDQTGLPRVRQLFDAEERHADVYWGFETVPHAAILYSRTTAEQYGRDRIADRFGDHYRGGFRALEHGHVQNSFILEDDLTDERLARYRVVYLENVACLSEAQLAALRRYVERGGGLVATGLTSLEDERGRRRPDFGLGDLFGVRLKGLPESVEPERVVAAEGTPQVCLRVEGGHPVAAGLPAGRLVPLPGEVHWLDESREYVVTELLPGEREVVAELSIPFGNVARGLQFPLGHPPGVVASRAGRGRVVYIAGYVGRRYLRRGPPDVGRLICAAVDWAAGGAPPYRVDAPSGVWVNLTASPDGRASALHLINYVGNRDETAAYRTTYFAPVAPIPVALRLAGRRAAAVRRLMTGEELPFEVVGDELRLVLPDLATHETLLIRHDGRAADGLARAE